MICKKKRVETFNFSQDPLQKVIAAFVRCNQQKPWLHFCFTNFVTLNMIDFHVRVLPSCDVMKSVLHSCSFSSDRNFIFVVAPTHLNEELGGYRGKSWENRIVGPSHLVDAKQNHSTTKPFDVLPLTAKKRVQLDDRTDC